MGLLQDFKDLKWPGKAAVTIAALAGLASAGYGANILKSKKPLEDQVAVEDTYQPGKTEDGRRIYTFKTNDNQRKGVTYTFDTENAFKRFNNFIAIYTADHEQELKGRDYLTPREAREIAALIDAKPYGADRLVITDKEMGNAISTYQQKPEEFKITFDVAAPKQTGKEFDLEAEANAEYEKLERDQDKYLEMCRAKIGTRQERVHKLWGAAEAIYQRDLRSNAEYQRAKAEFNHYRK
jgi:hypothetical protein